MLISFIFYAKTRADILVEFGKRYDMVIKANKKHKKDKDGSSGRTRTCNLVVTSAPEFLLGLDYLITRASRLTGGCRA
ncbi:MAG: hypothetical protein N3B16_11445, partial [Candidatus Aminicenantes bacterium]|nr:hypothetical protein [Candidatus Aminicenantes bacterium]